LALFTAISNRSWRHTPFRNNVGNTFKTSCSSWRHTPFRNAYDPVAEEQNSSWRHTPFKISPSMNAKYNAFMAAYAI